MSWEVNDHEFEAVLREGAEKQYRYFVGHCADWGEVWGLAVDGTDWAMVEDDAGVGAGLAVWPHPRLRGGVSVADGLYTPVAPRQLRSDLEAKLVRIE